MGSLNNPFARTPTEINTRRKTKFLLGILVLLNVADAIISQFIIMNGYGSEANPLMSYWVTKNHFVLIKAGATIIAALLLWDLSRRAPKPILSITILAVTLYVIIIWWNIFVVTTAF